MNGYRKSAKKRFHAKKAVQIIGGKTIVPFLKNRYYLDLEKVPNINTP